MVIRSSQFLFGIVITAGLAGCALTAKLTGHGPHTPGTPATGGAAATTSGTPVASTAGATPAASGGSAAPAEDPDQPKERSEGIPQKVIDLVHEAYFPDPDRPGQEIGPRNNYYDALRPAAKAFEDGWAAFDKRSTVVKAAVAQAADLEKAGKLAEARAALEAVITPVTPDADGKLDPRARQTLDPRDAELPAVQAWIHVVAAIGDKKALVEAGRMLYVRRKPRDRDTEMWFWLSAAADKTMGFLVSENTPGIRSDIYKIWDEAAKVRGASPFDTEGQRLAANHFAGLAQYGLSWTTVDVEKGKKGDWVMIRVEPFTLGDKEVKHSSTEEWRVPKNCHETNKLDYWGDDGRAHYQVACDYDYFSRAITLKAPVPEVPAWVKGRDMVLVVGKIASPGPTWKLSDAFIPDLRFSETGFLF